MINYLFLEVSSGRECVLSLSGNPPKIGERETGVLDDNDLHEVVECDPQPFNHNGDLITGGRVWVRKLNSH